MNFSKELQIFLALILLLYLYACGTLWYTNSSGMGADLLSLDRAGDQTPTPFQPDDSGSVEAATPSSILPVSTATDTPQPQYLWISPVVPEPLRQFATQTGYPLTENPSEGTFRLDITTTADYQSTWIYALVTPFPTLVDNVPLADLQAAWNGGVVGSFAGTPIWMDESTLNIFSLLWGPPAARAVGVASPSDLLDTAWTNRLSWAIVPFDKLEPRWKVLSVDGQSPLHNDFDVAAYPLKAEFSLQPAGFPLLTTNRDSSKLTVVAMTGVTALVRGTADRMERYGVLYPDGDVRDVLRSADITHISNEVPFADGCPPPDPYTQSLRFCSDPRYIALLEDVGTDVVELTGNHYQDYGSAAALLSIDIYDEHGMLHFGGGRNLTDSFQPALVTNNGNKLAFLGCNYAGPASDWATDSQPGSTPCDFPRLAAILTDLRSQGYLPIMTFQYYEYDQAFPTDYEQAHFRSMADAGAVIVSGSQSHFPAMMEFYGNAFIHYGLGNTFFDQMWSEETRTSFIDRHVFYDGRYIGTELLTYMLEDYARPRTMTETERLNFLRFIFETAGW